MTAPVPSEWSLPQLNINRDGDWLNEGIEITHAGILANLRENLRLDADGYYVQAGPVRIPVEVEDTPFAVIRVEAEGDGLKLTLNDETQEPLDPLTLRFAQGKVPYCRVKGGQFEARLTPQATWQLAQFLEYDEASNSAILCVAGACYPVMLAEGSDRP